MSIITFSVCKFQSTPSVGRATFKRAERNANRFGISIHALRGEGDMWLRSGMVSGFIFQSTPSVGRATSLFFVSIANLLFQSTPSVGRATLFVCFEKIVAVIFQSTPSVGRATEP